MDRNVLKSTEPPASTDSEEENIYGFGEVFVFTNLRNPHCWPWLSTSMPPVCNVWH